jgi:hypothetical protein
MNTAYSLVGDQPVYAIRNMVKALHMCEWLNTESDLQRRIAGQFILMTGKAYRSHCNLMLDVRGDEKRRKQPAA